jgi:hypothetical protein
VMEVENMRQMAAQLAVGLLLLVLLFLRLQ